MPARRIGDQADGDENDQRRRVPERLLDGDEDDEDRVGDQFEEGAVLDHQPVDEAIDRVGDRRADIGEHPPSFGKRPAAAPAVPH